MSLTKSIFIILFIFIVLFIGCTSNSRVKNFGGTTTVLLDSNKELVNVTWKDNVNLWILVKDRDKNKSPQTYEFVEKSNYGILEGKVVIKEQ